MNELDRLLKLSEFNIDFNDIQANFKDLNRMAAKIAGTDISLVNLVDSYTQWTVSSHGLELKQMPRNESVCQYTINEKGNFEVPDLSADPRFQDFFYVKGDLGLKYYFGVPLAIEEGVNIGALCVLHPQAMHLSEDKIDFLKIIADEIVDRLRALKTIEKLKGALQASARLQRKMLYDVRGPVCGIIGLSNVLIEQGVENNLSEVLEYLEVIQRSATSVIQISDEMLSSQEDDLEDSENFNLQIFKHKLEKLYSFPAQAKSIGFQIAVSTDTELIPIPKLNLMQIAGNLISNAIKFTADGGTVFVDIKFEQAEMADILHIKVKDTGIGLTQKQVELIRKGKRDLSLDPGGDNFIFGLVLVKSLIDSLNGELKVSSTPGKGSIFEAIFLI